MTEVTAPTAMNFTADFTSFQLNNGNEWAGSTGGAGVKRRDEIESEQINKDDNYHTVQGNTALERVVSMGEFGDSFGNSILTNIARDSKQPINFMNSVELENEMNASQEAINISTENLATTPAILPSDMTTYDRLNATSPAYDVGSLTNPDTLGDTLSGLVEKVHANAQSYENQSDALMKKNKGTPFDQAKDSMISSYDSLSGGLTTRESKQSKIERQMESYIQVMNSSYEYYIYSSLFVDAGKSISQTAQTLTKG